LNFAQPLIGVAADRADEMGWINLPKLAIYQAKKSTEYI
jgi:hypothetical protein